MFREFMASKGKADLLVSLDWMGLQVSFILVSIDGIQGYLGCLVRTVTLELKELWEKKVLREILANRDKLDLLER